METPGVVTGIKEALSHVHRAADPGRPVIAALVYDPSDHAQAACCDGVSALWREAGLRDAVASSILVPAHLTRSHGKDGAILLSMYPTTSGGELDTPVMLLLRGGALVTALDGPSCTPAAVRAAVRDLLPSDTQSLLAEAGAASAGAVPAQPSPSPPTPTVPASSAPPSHPAPSSTPPRANGGMAGAGAVGTGSSGSPGSSQAQRPRARGRKRVDPQREGLLEQFERDRRNRAAAKASREAPMGARRDDAAGTDDAAPAPPTGVITAPHASRARVQIRCDGMRPVVVEMSADATLEELYLEASSRLSEQAGFSGPFTMTSTVLVPNRTFDETDYQQPLHTLGLVPSATVIMAEADTAPFEAAASAGAAPTGGSGAGSADGGSGDGGWFGAAVRLVGSIVQLGASSSDGAATRADDTARASHGAASGGRGGGDSGQRARGAPSQASTSSRVSRRAGLGRNVHGLNTTHSGDRDGQDSNEFFGGDSTAYLGRPGGDSQ